MLEVRGSAAEGSTPEPPPRGGSEPQALPPRLPPDAVPSVSRTDPPAPQAGGSLFASGLLGEPPRRRGLGLSISLLAHVLAIAGFALVPLLAPTALPEVPDLVRVRLYVPAPPPPPPPKGSGLYPKATRGPEAPPAPVAPERPPLTAPLESPATEPAPAPGQEAEGGSFGSDAGVPEGEPGGVEGGVVGGVPGGVVGGILGGELPVPVASPDRPPRLLHQTRPRYPQQAFVQKVEGVVLLEILIDADGHVARARIVHSVPLLDGAALEAVREWRFVPALKAGRPVASLAFAPVSFRIY
jgi:protein TonB